MGVIAKKTVKKSSTSAGRAAAAGPVAAAKPLARAVKTPPKMASRAATPVQKTEQKVASGKLSAAAGKTRAVEKTAVASKNSTTSSTGNIVVVKSQTVKQTASATARPGTGKSAGKTIDKTPEKAVASAAREVDSKATKSGISAGGSKAGASKAANQQVSAGLKDKIEKPVVLKVSEVATKTPKTTPDTQTLLTEEQILKMGEKDYMNEAQLAFFKARLQQLEKDLLKNAGETTEHLRETVLVPDPADRATIEEEHALELRTRDRERKLLKKVQQSIVSIDAGEYGWCEETGEPIGIPRLLARPTATLSLEAQQRRELKQKLYGD